MLLPSPTPSLILFIGLGLEAANNQSARALSSIKLVQENEERLMKETESTSFFLVITLSSIVFFSFGLRLMIEQVMTWLAAVSSLIGDRDSQPGLTSGYKRFPLPSISIDDPSSLILAFRRLDGFFVSLD